MAKAERLQISHAAPQRTPNPCSKSYRRGDHKRCKLEWFCPNEKPRPKTPQDKQKKIGTLQSKTTRNNPTCKMHKETETKQDAKKRCMNQGQQTRRKAKRKAKKQTKHEKRTKHKEPKRDGLQPTSDWNQSKKELNFKRIGKTRPFK